MARAAKASWSYPAAWLEAWSPQLTFTADYVRRHAVYVAEVDGAIAGVAALEGAEVAHLWVRPDRQGGGVGRALLERLVEQARERGWTELRVVSDPNARPFYERFGATHVGDVAAPVAGIDRTIASPSLIHGATEPVWSSIAVPASRLRYPRRDGCGVHGS